MNASRKGSRAVVVGGGPAGLAAGLALSTTGVETWVAAPPHPPLARGRDDRTAALFAGSITLLRNLGVWEAIEPHAAPILAIRLIDDRDALLKAPEVLFTAEEAGLCELGYNVPNEALVQALTARARASGPGLTLLETAGAKSLEIDAERVAVRLAEGRVLEAELVAGADGRGSLCRTAAGIGTTSWSYPQSALVCSFTHGRDHRGVSTEFHRAGGPFTVVPLPGRSSSLVWVERPEEAERLAGLDDAALRAAMEDRLRGLLGTIGEIGRRSVFPLSGLTAERFAANRVALVGEAGHVIPPIGAQGLNLSLRDAAVLADTVASALRQGGDIGGPAPLAAYSAARAPDVAQRTLSVDMLSRSLLSPLLPVHLARGLGLFALKGIAPLRRLLVREGLQPSADVPSLMRPDGLPPRRPGAQADAGRSRSGA